MTLHKYFRSYLDDIRQERRYRVFTYLERHAAHPPYASWRSGDVCREVVVWCSNDYLGMARNPAVADAMVQAAIQMGVSADGTRNISGNSHALVQLEAELAGEMQDDPCPTRLRWHSARRKTLQKHLRRFVDNESFPNRSNVDP